MELELINNELSESRMYRTTANMSKLSGRDIADLLYLNTIVLYMLVQDSVQNEYAKSYAKQTSQYGPYNAFKTHATDLYMLCYTVTNPESRYLKIRDTDFLKSLSFNSMKHVQFMRTISAEKDLNNETVSYFFRLESQLKITNSEFKQYRRYITNWGNLKYSSRQLVVSKIVQKMRNLARGSELISNLNTMVKYKKYTPDTNYKQPRTSFAKRAAGAAVGAAAGRYVAGKVSNTNKAKNIGTGLGAIAGYWASGRKKQ